MDERKESEFYKFCCGIWNTVDHKIIYLVHLENFHEVVFFFSLHIFSVVWTQIYKYFIYIFGWMLLVWGGVVFEDWFHNGAAIFNSHLQSENVNHSTIHVHNRHLQNNLHFTNVYRSKFLKNLLWRTIFHFMIGKLMWKEKPEVFA